MCCFECGCFVFFKQKTAYEMRISDWSSDVCSSDLPHLLRLGIEQGQRRCIGDRVANASIGAGHRDQQSNTMPLRVRRKPWLNGCGGGCRDFRSCGSALWNNGLTARDQQRARHCCKAHEFPARGPYARLPFDTRLCHRSEEHTSELQSLMRISYAVFCLKKKTTK